ncbi:hypothetical protein AB6A40_003741 [Gnathostoma spinigerum]|uniref:Fibulin-1 n=1 Tax=Gnathostoma spinigerum TaxID=75299 RepID=A0ABD6EKD3_9BILA
MFFALYLLPLTFGPNAALTTLQVCCSGGARNYRQTGNCSNIQNVGSGVPCRRAASICCLRAILVQSCEEGRKMAEMGEYCPADISGAGGAIKKECCDCCRLANDLKQRKNTACEAPVGFSPACHRVFNQCCQHIDAQFGDFPRDSHAPPLVSDRSKSDDVLQVSTAGDRCSKCEQFCTDLGDSVECSCGPGYDLAPDGSSCVDIDECDTSERYDSPQQSLPCMENEYCENLIGSYRCHHMESAVPLYSAHSVSRLVDERSPPTYQFATSLTVNDASRCPPGWELSPSDGNCVDIDECHLPHVCLADNTHCLNIPGSFACVCLRGFYWSGIASLCVDIDECLLLSDNCLEGQRCLNVPGSFKCLRTLSCGTGYALDSETEQCIDVDECNLGSHDCGPLYQCRNTQGSYRCDPKKCRDDEVMNTQTGECIRCPSGFKPKRGRCEDVNECEEVGRCRPFEECINTPGSFRCQEKGNLCMDGYTMDRDTGFCVDINECAMGTHKCGDELCINLPGSYKCRCSAGFEFNSTTKQCEDVDECQKITGQVCSLHAKCENTVGSFRCHCNKGFRLADDGRNCHDIDECTERTAECAENQRCVNIPGSYQCICSRGYRLSADGVTCEDIDECLVWAETGDELCMGKCTNVPGSYKCDCPPGYEIQEDGQTCKDIDECAMGECRGPHRICINTLGDYKCHRIVCPKDYVHDKNYKNTVDDGYSCLKQCRKGDARCLGNHTMEILYQFHAIPTTKVLFEPLEVSRIRTHMDIPFAVRYRVDRSNRDKFIVVQRRNVGIVKLNSPIQGPRVELVRLHIFIYSRNHVLIAYNVALIRVYVSAYHF